MTLITSWASRQKIKFGNEKVVEMISDRDIFKSKYSHIQKNKKKLKDVWESKDSKENIFRVKRINCRAYVHIFSGQHCLSNI